MNEIPEHVRYRNVQAGRLVMAEDLAGYMDSANGWVRFYREDDSSFCLRISDIEERLSRRGLAIWPEEYHNQ